MSDFIYPIQKEYRIRELSGDLDYKLFITNVLIFEDSRINEDCYDWLEENIGKIWIDWAWPTARIPQDPNDSERWIMMLFKNEADALKFKLVWG